MAISQPISAGVIAHRRTSTGRTNASDSASKASKNVALPTMRRARRCQRENGMLSSRAKSDGSDRSRAAAFAEASADKSDVREETTQLRRDTVGKFDGCQMPRAGNEGQGGRGNRVMKLPCHRHWRRVILLTNDDRGRHVEVRELRPRI